MSSGFESIDLSTFFEIGTQGMATRAVITDGATFTREVPGIFDLTSQDVALGAETGVDADEPVIECKATDVGDFNPRGMTLTMPDLEAHDDGFGKTYRIVRVLDRQQMTQMFLTEV